MYQKLCKEISTKQFLCFFIYKLATVFTFQHINIKLSNKIMLGSSLSSDRCHVCNSFFFIKEILNMQHINYSIRLSSVKLTNENVSNNDKQLQMWGHKYVDISVSM